MEDLIPFVLGAVVIWLYVRGKKRLNNSAPSCPKCGSKMRVPTQNAAYRRQTNSLDPTTQYGRALWKYRCPSCGYERVQ